MINSIVKDSKDLENYSKIVGEVAGYYVILRYDVRSITYSLHLISKETFDNTYVMYEDVLNVFNENDSVFKDELWEMSE